MNTDSKPFLTVKDAAKKSGFSVFFWRKSIASGLVPTIKSGNKYYIDYDRAIEKLRGGETK